MVTSPVAISHAVNMPSRRCRIFNFNVLLSHVLTFCRNIRVKGLFVDQDDWKSLVSQVKKGTNGNGAALIDYAALMRDGHSLPRGRYVPFGNTFVPPT
jgi:hypothetical protein